ncbi:hypothetical protein EHS39_11595 [Ensifer sp. MPMI2T]|nr:hypothetical protein EHS39_11595 [Ensifer sp. MPMI2T]
MVLAACANQISIAATTFVPKVDPVAESVSQLQRRPNLEHRSSLHVANEDFAVVRVDVVELVGRGEAKAVGEAEAVLGENLGGNLPVANEDNAEAVVQHLDARLDAGIHESEGCERLVFLGDGANLDHFRLLSVVPFGDYCFTVLLQICQHHLRKNADN